MAKVKVFVYGRRQRRRRRRRGYDNSFPDFRHGELKNYGTMFNVLSKGIHMCNMYALSLLVRKLLPRLEFFKSWPNFKVKVTTYTAM